MSSKAQKATPIIQINNLKIEGFSDEQWHPIIKGVNLTLKRGQVMGLIGESGAGKSTLGLAAMGYTQPGCRITGGEILFEGVDLASLRDSEKQNQISYTNICSPSLGSLSSSQMPIETVIYFEVEVSKWISKLSSQRNK